MHAPRSTLLTRSQDRVDVSAWSSKRSVAKIAGLRAHEACVANDLALQLSLRR